MNIELILSPALFAHRELKRHNTVVVDVLRATSSICAAFDAGAEEVVPLDSLEPLPYYESLGYTLAAERNAKKVGHAQCGNSPCEYLTMDLHGKRLAYSTTNGTVGLILAEKESLKTLAGCFSNLGALSRYLLAEKEDLVILCSGWKNGVSLEDTLMAGALILKLDSEYQTMNDAAEMARTLYESVGYENLQSYCQRGTHIQRLLKMGYANDVEYVFHADTSQSVPRLKDGKLSVEPIQARP